MLRALAALLIVTAAPGAGSPDAGAPAKREADAPARVPTAAELRTIPAPLRFGRFHPVVGEYVDFDVTSGKAQMRVRASVVGRKEEKGIVQHQLELDFQTNTPRVLLVLHVAEAPVRKIGQVVFWTEPVAPVATLFDLPIPAVSCAPEKPEPVTAGPFRGPGVRTTCESELGPAEVVLSDKVPVFGLARLKVGEERWVARSAGTDAHSRLTSVPMVVPRIEVP